MTMTSSHFNRTNEVNEICLIDPLSHAGKLSIPIEYTHDTKGRQEWLRAAGHLRKDLSLCCLFQQGRCHAGQRCHQIHVDCDYIAELRAANANKVTCCQRCGDAASADPVYQDMVRGASVSVITSDGPIDIYVDRLALTQGLEVILNQRRGTNDIVFPASRVCRLHLRNNCKYGKDCKNVHICYKLSHIVNGAVPKTQPRRSSNTSHSRHRASSPGAPVEVGIAARNESTSPSRYPSEEATKPSPPLLIQEDTKSLSRPKVQPLSAFTVTHVTTAAPSNTQPAVPFSPNCRAATQPATPTALLTSFFSQWHANAPGSPVTLPSPVSSLAMAF